MTDAAKPIPGSYWVVPGQLAGGPYAASWIQERALERLARLLKVGITFFVDLTEKEHSPSSENRHLWSRKSLRIETLSYIQSKDAQAPWRAANEGRFTVRLVCSPVHVGRANVALAHFHPFDVSPLAAAWGTPTINGCKPSRRRWACRRPIAASIFATWARQQTS